MQHQLGSPQRQALAHVAPYASGTAVDPSLRVTLNFHPDRWLAGLPILESLARDGIYRSQFETGSSNGGLTAHPGGDRWRRENRQRDLPAMMRIALAAVTSRAAIWSRVYYPTMYKAPKPADFGSYVRALQANLREAGRMAATRDAMSRQPELVEPMLRLHSSWLDAHAEWGPGLHEDGLGLSPSVDVVSPAGFSAWVSRLISASDPRTADDPTAPRCIYRWIVEGDEVLGGIALRHGDSDFIRWAGHVGYGIRPSARRRGLATWALGNILNDARLLSMSRVLLVCDVDNTASATTIERNGGLLESIQETEHGPARRYWIASP